MEFNSGLKGLMQHLVSSLSVSDRPMNMCTGRSLTHGYLLTMVINIEIILCDFNVKPKESERKMRASLDDYIKITEHCELFVVCPEFQRISAINFNIIPFNAFTWYHE
jgi:hypothetical protein